MQVMVAPQSELRKHCGMAWLGWKQKPVQHTEPDGDIAQSAGCQQAERQMPSTQAMPPVHCALAVHEGRRCQLGWHTPWSQMSL